MNQTLKSFIWPQFGAAIDMMKNAINEADEQIWQSDGQRTKFWYLAYHAIFWLDLYLSPDPDNFAPPQPYGLSELDPEGILPERVYSQQELLDYLQYCREKCQATIMNLTDEQATARFRFGTIDLPFAELLLYNMRHVQHHAAQMNLILAEKYGSAPRWVRQST